MFTKEKIAMVVAELLGTFVLTYVVLTVMLSNIGIGYFIALAAGLALGLLVLVLGGVSGAILNPAVTIGLWSVRRLQTYQAIIYLAIQLVGALLAYLLFKYISGNDLAQREFAKYDATILVAELLGTAVLAMGYAAAAYQNLLQGSKAFIIGAAFTVGILLAASQSVAGYLNPAIALGAHAIDLGDWGSWGNFVLGPVLGAVIGMNLYNFLFAANVPVAATATAPARTAAAKAGRTKTASRAKATKKTTARRKK